VDEAGPFLEELDRQQCLALASNEPVGRLAVSVDALPAVFPVNFAIASEDVVFRCTVGTKFAAATMGSVVAFEVDSFDAGEEEGWSVLIQGVAEEVTDPTDQAALAALPLVSWGLGDAADRFLRIRTTLMSGRRIRRSPAATPAP
jgi:nitroimidazol reductase NimA-like FMN-containing flavoprotein (pyridoxamine 5'-phosphate oxidase superfamily)